MASVYVCFSSQPGLLSKTVVLKVQNIVRNMVESFVYYLFEDAARISNYMTSKDLYILMQGHVKRFLST
jgi:hypothetical protein